MEAEGSVQDHPGQRSDFEAQPELYENLGGWGNITVFYPAFWSSEPYVTPPPHPDTQQYTASPISEPACAPAVAECFP